MTDKKVAAVTNQPKSKWDIPERTWEKSDEPWNIPTNPNLGVNYLEPTKQFAKDWMGKKLTASEFAAWCALQPSLVGRTDYNAIRRGIQLCGYRYSNEVPFDMDRTGKQTWIVRTIVEAILTTPALENGLKGVQKDADLFCDRLRAVDLEQMDPETFRNILGIFKMFRRVIRHTKLDGADMHAEQQLVFADLAKKALPPASPQLEN